jgi:hypothetical protein
VDWLGAGAVDLLGAGAVLGAGAGADDEPEELGALDEPVFTEGFLVGFAEVPASAELLGALDVEGLADV